MHVLKTWPEHFEAIVSGRKRCEVRFNDRDYRVGDSLILKEWNPLDQSYTGRIVKKYISHILHGGEFGIQSGYVVLSLQTLRP